MTRNFRFKWYVTLIALAVYALLALNGISALDRYFSPFHFHVDQGIFG